MNSPLQKHKWGLCAALVVTILVGASIYVHRGGFLFGEADLFLVDYNSERPYLSKILCPHINESKMYQAREFSFIFDHIDAKFIYACTQIGMPHFYSLTHYTLIALSCVVVWKLATLLGVSSRCAALLIAMLLTAPCVFLSGMFIRSSHILEAFLWLLIVFHLTRMNLSGVSRLRFFTLFLLSLALCWSGRMGYMLLLGMVLAAAVWPGMTQRAMQIGMMAMAAIVQGIYNKWIGPDLVRKVTGFPVGMEWQSPPIQELSADLVGSASEGIKLFGNTLGWLWGCVSAGAAVFLVLWAVWAIRNRRQSLALYATLAMIATMNTFMVLRNKALAWPDVRSYSYWIPETFMFLCIGAFLLHRLAPKAMDAVLAVALIGNLFALPTHKQISGSGHMVGYYAGAPHLLTAIRTLYSVPTGPGSDRKYDEAATSRYDGFDHTLANPITKHNMPIQEFVESSNYYQWLLWKRGHTFKQW